MKDKDPAELNPRAELQQQISFVGLIVVSICVGVAAVNSNLSWNTSFNVAGAIFFVSFLFLGLSRLTFDEKVWRRILQIAGASGVSFLLLSNLLANPFAAFGLILGWVGTAVIVAIDIKRVTGNE